MNSKDRGTRCTPEKPSPCSTRNQAGPTLLEAALRELEPADIAAALAMVEAGIGREVLCLIWWPDGATLTADQLRAKVDDLIFREWMRREQVMLDGQLAVAMRGGQACRIYAAALAQRWPRIAITAKGLVQPIGTYAKVRDAVLNELGSTGLCPACQGRAFITIAASVQQTCGECKGSGQYRVSERSRAEACKLSWETFRDTWASVYDWLFQACMDGVHKADRQFQAAIG